MLKQYAGFNRAALVGLVDSIDYKRNNSIICLLGMEHFEKQKNDS